MILINFWEKFHWLSFSLGKNHLDVSIQISIEKKLFLTFFFYHFFFFFKNLIKNLHLFFKGAESETGRIELSPDVYFWHMSWKTLKRSLSKKIRESCNFWDISKISRTNVRQPDTYLEKNHCDFRTIIFGAKKFFTENRVSIFAKKLDRKFVFLEKKGIVQKRKMSRFFLTSSPWKLNGNYGRKNLFKENGKKIATRGIFGGFLQNFRKSFSCL